MIFRIKVNNHVYDVEADYQDDALVKLLRFDPDYPERKVPFCLASHIEIDLLGPKQDNLAIGG